MLKEAMKDIINNINDIQEYVKKDIYKKYGSISDEQMREYLEKWEKFGEIKEKFSKKQNLVEIDDSFKRVDHSSDHEYDDVKIAMHSIASRKKEN